MSKMLEPVNLSDSQPKKQIPVGYQRHLQLLFKQVVEARQHVIDCEAAIMKAQAAAIRKKDDFVVALSAIKEKLGVDPTWDMAPDYTMFYELIEGLEETLPEDVRKELPVDADAVLKDVAADNDDHMDKFFNSLQGKL